MPHGVKCIEVGPSPSLPRSVWHEIVFLASSARLSNVPELSLLTLLSFHCLLRLAKARHLRGCDVQTFVGSLSARFEKVSGIVNISRMAGHAAHQHMPFECFGLGQLVNSMRSSIPGRRFDTTIWPSVPSKTCSPRKLQTVSVHSQS